MRFLDRRRSLAVAINLLKKINPMSLVIASIILYSFHDFAVGAVEASLWPWGIILAPGCTPAHSRLTNGIQSEK